MNERYVVLADPEDEYWEGGIVDATIARTLAARDVAMLPVVTDFLKAGGIGGYTKRAWGSGWDLASTTPRIQCPLTLYCAADTKAIFVYWKALLVLSPDIAEAVLEGKQKLQGAIHLTADSSQPISTRAGVSADVSISGDDLTPNKFSAKHEGFIVGGRTKIMLPAPSVYGFALYGQMPGARVKWAAASQALEESR